jgi:hypothetical protein
MKRILITAALLFATGNAFAESPYQGMQSRTVKALSEQQVADLNEGRGMGMALAAEHTRLAAIGATTAVLWLSPAKARIAT